MIHENRDGLCVCFKAVLCSNHWNKSKEIWWTDEEHTQEDCSVSTVVQMLVFSWSQCGFFSAFTLQLGHLYPRSTITNVGFRFQARFIFCSEDAGTHRTIKSAWGTITVHTRLLNCSHEFTLKVRSAQKYDEPERRAPDPNRYWHFHWQYISLSFIAND